MESRPGQFRIFDLFVLMTVAAIAFALLRLPLPMGLRFLPISAVLICYYGWLVRNRKYPLPIDLHNDPEYARRAARQNAITNWVMSGVLLVLTIWFFFLGKQLFGRATSLGYTFSTFTILQAYRATFASIQGWLPKVWSTLEGPPTKTWKERLFKFRILDLLFVTTVAAIVFAIVRLPIALTYKIWPFSGVFACLIEWPRFRVLPNILEKTANAKLNQETSLPQPAKVE